ncbi:MAG: 4-alpha-glucanotransferase [Eubacteriales bacterium]
MRSSGILMHISTLPGSYGCGSFGKEAYDFVDFLAESGFRIWQTLPFGVPDQYGSPYKSYSAFAGNPYFIDLDALRQDGLLTEDELRSAKQQTPYLCEFQRLAKERLPLLRKAAARVEDRKTAQKLVAKYPHLQAYCRFMALRDANPDKLWNGFTAEADPEEVFFHTFLQYTFLTQWLKLKEYANQKGISIIGDIPIYVDYDSADVWENPTLFQLGADLRPEAVAGVPPDYFSPDGQLWGNPLYNWDKMKEDGYRWWRDRIRWQLTLFDGIRIDHFRGFSAYFSVPADAKTAKGGRWVKGPGLPFVKTIQKEAKGKLIIAEDLGDIDEDVVRLLTASGLPGMRVFQFAFLAEDSVHKPHFYPENCVAYSGTHDNNTLLGYLWELDDDTRRYMLEYCGHRGEWQSGCDTILRTLLRTPAERVIFPIQDILGYGADTRMNTPGVATGNWAYRVTAEQLGGIDRGYWKWLNQMYGR